DTVSAAAKRTDAGIFSKVIALSGANITAKATARVGPPAQALHVAPMVVYCGHSLIQNCNNDHTPQFNVPTAMDSADMGAPGAFGMLILDGERGTIGSSTEAD